MPHAVLQVVSALASDPDFLKKLFVSLEAADPGSGDWVDLVAFLQVREGIYTWHDTT